MKVKFQTTSHAKLKDVPVVSGQIVATRDLNGFYYDMNNQRHALQPKDDVLYSLIDSSKTTSSGITGDISYTVDTGTLADKINVNACVYASLEFVFYDRGSGTQFSARLHGLPYGTDGLFTYNWCNKATGCMNIDPTQTLGGTNIYRETLYSTAVVMSDGTWKVTSKTSIYESVINGVMTMTETDLSDQNRVALIKIVGRR